MVHTESLRVSNSLPNNALFVAADAAYILELFRIHYKAARLTSDPPHILGRTTCCYGNGYQWLPMSVIVVALSNTHRHNRITITDELGG